MSRYVVLYQLDWSGPLYPARQVNISVTFKTYENNKVMICIEFLFLPENKYGDRLKAVNCEA
jgi:hypothetical protein